ncbi:beta subunit of fatty acid synthetase [Rhizoclosmatium hyalinum]|nr:beta subunit of fatty acid synthetase [Rhizoclosmatium hyalinum]
MSDEASWENTYKDPTGGIVTVKSELGEPIHKIANRFTFVFCLDHFRSGGSWRSYPQKQGKNWCSAGIRRVPNIIIVVGSVFGDAEGTVPYLTGECPTQFDYAPMPFDGILVGRKLCQKPWFGKKVDRRPYDLYELYSLHCITSFDDHSLWVQSHDHWI